MNLIKDLAIGAADHFRKVRESSETVAQVNALLDRVANGMLPSDRQESLDSLKVLLQSSSMAIREFAVSGIPAMCKVLRDEWRDAPNLELAQGVVEALLIATDPAAGDTPPQAGPTSRHPSQNTVEALCREEVFVPLMLSLLEMEDSTNEDVYMRFWIVQILFRMATAAPQHVQAHVLQQEQGVARLMVLLGSQEAIRNETLLLLLRLTEGSHSMQQAVAAEGAFDTLFEIIAEEGYSSGGILAQDCLQLLLCLLRGRTANQQLFRESGYVGNMKFLLRPPPLPQAPPPGGTGASSGAPTRYPLDPEAAANLQLAIRIVSTLITQPSLLEGGADGPAGESGGAATADMGGAEGRVAAAACVDANLAVISQTPVQGALVALLGWWDGAEAAEVELAALKVLSAILQGRRDAAEVLGGVQAGLPDGSGSVVRTSAVQVILHVAVNGLGTAGTAAAVQLLEALLLANGDTQRAWASTLLTPSDTGHTATSFPGLLLPNLSVTPAAVAAPAGAAAEAPPCGLAATASACVLRSLLFRNPHSQQQLLAVEVAGERSSWFASARTRLLALVLQQLDAAASSLTRAHAARYAAQRMGPSGPGSTGGQSATGSADGTDTLAAGPAASVALRALLSVLFVWVHGAPAAAAEAVREPGAVPQLLGLMGSTDGGVRTLAAAVLGAALGALCAAVEPEHRSAAHSVLDTVTGRVGTRGLYTALDSVLREDLQEVAADAADRQLVALAAAVMSKPMSELLREAVPGLKDALTALLAGPAALRSAHEGEGMQEAASAPGTTASEARQGWLAETPLAHAHNDGGASISGPSSGTGQEASAAPAVHASGGEVAPPSGESAPNVDDASAEAIELLEDQMAKLSDLYTEVQAELAAKRVEVAELQERLAAREAVMTGTVEADDDDNQAHDAAAETNVDELQEEMDDLLVCLGQEELKVEVLSGKLLQLGVDPMELIGHIGSEEPEDEPDIR